MNSEIHFLIRFVSKKINNSSRGKMVIILFYSAIVKENWAHLTSRRGAKFTTMFRLENVLIVLPEKHIKNICFTLSRKIMVCYFKFHFKK